ncbi:MAG: PfkB family carbohydrate kinase [Candidatus Gallimonas sp.]
MTRAPFTVGGSGWITFQLGGAGSEWRYRGRSGKVPSVSVKPVDTTGAGDAFYAGVLTGLDNPQAQWTDEFLNETFRFANVCGALNTLGRGAIDCLPDREEVEAVLKTL